MGDDGQRHGDAHASADLEGRAEGDPVGEAVADHRGGRRQPHLGHPGAVLGAVRGLTYRQQAFHDVRDQEPGHEEQQGERDTEHLAARRVQRLREQVEADDAQHQPAGEAQHEVAAVGDALRRPSARQGHQERAQRHDHGHVPLNTDCRPRAHVPARVAGHELLTREG
ncbi:hypothetical protein GCM10020254_63040 [Streptomyces goshikiensis]